MNELFAAEPTACASSVELKLLLGYFGPYAGRYLVEYPGVGWHKSVIDHYAAAGDMERKRVTELLKKARDISILPPPKGLAWKHTESWLSNAMQYMKETPPIFSGVITTNEQSEHVPPIHTLQDLDLSPTADERIQASPEEYVRVCRTLLLISHELYFVDPYLKLTNKSVRDVIRAFLGVLPNGKCAKVVFVTRASEVFGRAHQQTIVEDYKKELAKLAKKEGVKPEFVIEFLFVDDEQSNSKMHGRYLLSLKGGIRLDQGFQTLPEGRKVDVGPVGKALWGDLWSVFHEEKDNMKIVESFSFSL